MLFSSYKYDNIRNFYFLLIVLIGTLCGCSPDNEENFTDGGMLFSLLDYGQLNSTRSEYCIVKFSLPPINRESVVFTDDDIIDEFLIKTDVLIPQGTKMRNGILHTVYGFNTDSYPSWYVKYDLDNKIIISKVKLDKRYGEPEAV